MRKRWILPAAAMLMILTGCAALTATETETAETPTEAEAIEALNVPEPSFSPYIMLGGQRYGPNTRKISYVGRTREELPDDLLEQIAAERDSFPQLESVDLTGCGYTEEELTLLEDEMPGVAIGRDIEICGVTVSTLDTEIDLSGVRMEDTVAVEEALPHMRRLEKVVMCECGLSNEVMDDLNRRYEDVRFVWMVHIQYGGYRTDTTHFTIYNPDKQYFSGEGMKALRYLTDLEALDLGHIGITEPDVMTCFPHLKYLVIAETSETPLDFLTTMPDLVWLEMFNTAIVDPTPLLSCKNLRDLNICYTWGDSEKIVEVLSQMTWLKRIWCSGINLSNDQLDELRAALPDCEIWDEPGDESTGFTWRYNEDYYEMRDALDMYYMDITGNHTTRKTEEEIDAIYEAAGIERPGH